MNHTQRYEISALTHSFCYLIALEMSVSADFLCFFVIFLSENLEMSENLRIFAARRNY